jgi:hypothetical protein
VAEQHRVDRRQVVEGNAGRRDPLGAANATELARSDQTGSVRMLTPAAWISVVAWPTTVVRRPPTRASGRIGVTGTARGHHVGRLPSFQRSPSVSMRSVDGWPGLKKRVPST